MQCSLNPLIPAAALLLGMTAPVHAAGARTVIDQALADPSRATDRRQDARRHPAELVALAHVARGQNVLDLIPGGGYWTRIFSRVVGPTGHVYAVWPNAYAKLATRDVTALRKTAASPAYRNVAVAIQPQALPTAPTPLDVVWTSQNYHDYADPFLGSPGPDALARDAFRLLRPGGYFIVIDHRSAAGRGMADTDTLHRIDPVIVRRQAEAAGFVFAGESRVLANASDPLTIKVFDPAIRGRTSQFAYAFRKPGGVR
ncbi:class I SAM-dependent methyltransferase [Sphingomonas sp. PAMC 26621]|uniref:class I SAM-dependent methyltransferase n=1 Tax=Sphingomonas sp. PAMC 26621 TaxID=1112213 RepID=UPI000289EAC2|nr:class I SAM-dependent methyltransferase [Sphingomonas sp. PAMC 26621]